jgi:hypothetical protein
MYLTFIDESGDVGLVNSPSNYFVLSALIIQESYWLTFIDDLIGFRRYLKKKYGLLMREEIHAGVFINGHNKLKGKIKRNTRLNILKECLKWLNTRPEISIITVRHYKTGSAPDVFDYTWRVFIQRFENTLTYKNFPGGTGNDTGLIISDNTDGGKLTSLLREMRRYNPIPNIPYYGSGTRNIQLRLIIEDPVLRDSLNSYILQMVDVVVYFARQFYEPNKYVRIKGARTFYKFVANITNPYVTRYTTNCNIVEV